MSLNKTASPSTANVGDVVTFTITLSNAGPNPATAVSVKDYVPAGFGSITAISDAGTLSGSTITWSGITVPVGANTVTRTFQATVLAPTYAPGEYKNTAQVTASAVYDPDSQPNNMVNNTPAQDDEDDAVVTVLEADLSLTKTVDNATPNVGSTVVFTITVNNAGPDAATNVAVKDLLPAGLTYVSDNSGGNYNDGTGIWTIGTIAAAVGSIEITATVTTSGAKRTTRR
ncbi:MAG: DUF11 domain-containing protein [Saprospirales bacterium]|nr:DUF11 domain-containing protein [Saprospirales bacterium]